jgi:prepilin-type N-terminal cleavage/methylation domain-containing protein
MRQLLKNSNSQTLLKNQQGFTIVEILVALFLVAMVVGLGLSDNFSSDEDISKETDGLQRAVGFMSDEAALRNTVVRLHLFLDKSPQEYAVEYGPGDSFILPPAQDFETTTMTKEEEEAQNKKLKDVNMKFNRIQEFQENNTEIDEDVHVIGIGNATSKRFVEAGEVSLYAYPTGEKDDGLIILASDNQITSITIDPFSPDTEKKTYKIENEVNRDLLVVQKEKAKEIFDLWLRER